jgi:hypothetical protein
MAAMLACVSSAHAESDEDLAKQLSNPISSLISVPFQYNYDTNIGPTRSGTKNTLNIQPVIPFALNQDWNLISRTIVPVVSQQDIFGPSGYQFGLSDTTQSLFFSPSKTVNGFTWGVGPVFLIPTGSGPFLSGEKWGTGVTGVALWQGSGWTIGALANQIWSVAGDPNAADINQMFLQPFISYTTPDAWTFTLNTESTYYWNTHQAVVPINAVVSKLVKVKGLPPMSIGGGVRYYADSTETSAHGFGGRAFITFLFPAK